MTTALFGGLQMDLKVISISLEISFEPGPEIAGVKVLST